MKTCDDVRGRLEEYFDGELRGDEASAVEAHVGACSACAEDLTGLRRLEDVLKGVPAGARPDGERYLLQVKSRLRSRNRARWMAVLPIAAAAGILIGLFYVVRAPQPLDVTALVEIYASDASRRASIERDLRGPHAVDQLKQLVRGGTARQQQTAAVILAKDEAVRPWLVDWTQARAASQEVELLEIGSEATDDELIGAAFELLRSSKTREDGVEVLRKLRKGGLNQRVDGAIVARVKWLLGSASPSDQGLGLEIIRTLGVRFPLPDVTDLLDVPELGDKASEFLRQQTGKDYGKDKEAWAQFFRRIN